MPNYVSSWVSLNYGRLTQLDNLTLAALELTAEALHTEVVNAQVMPFDTGNMQNAQTYVDTTDLQNGNVSIVTGSPQARRLYYHPEYDFQTVNNPLAGGLWYDSWVDGPFRDFCPKTFAALMERMGGH